MIYSSPTYSMGAIEVPAEGAIAPRDAKAKLASMKRELKGWLRWRKKSDDVASGKIVGKGSPEAFRQKLFIERSCSEQTVANDLFALLSECFDAAQLPDPDLGKDPEAAVKLAVIAVSGKMPEESVSPKEQGFIWMWPAVVLMGVVAFVITSKIRGEVEIEKERERTRCIQEAGWLACDEWALPKMGALALGGYFVWDRFLRRRKKKT